MASTYNLSLSLLSALSIIRPLQPAWLNITIDIAKIAIPGQSLH